MSGITPILDTLLHQVLGKRVDVPPARELTTPVQPPLSAEGPRAVHSDSRLDARPGASAGAVAETAGQSSSTRGRAPPQVSPLQDGGSTATRLSPAARLIGELLAQYPAPPLAVRTEKPLLAAVAGQSGEYEVVQLANALRHSIVSSGIFYESHLARWFRGELSRQALVAEPQAHFVTSPSGLSSSGIELPEALQQVVRHQLEVLSQPVLRWEGQVWPGIFTSLLIRGGEDAPESESEEEKAQKTVLRDEWQFKLTIGLEKLGEVRVWLALRAEALNVVVEATTANAEQQLRQGRQVLLERLSDGGFEVSDVRIGSVPVAEAGVAETGRDRDERR